ncbi:hypothetical protein [Pelomonas sp. BJYL3]|uniref:hypothetical protein n=1 Tax=Pelomonas sp. BJYL3 TaxID=2976697 RepID=UPI0022B386BC|nr:hypothetical protein [Pelomonas sp. BJYL3]
MKSRFKYLGPVTLLGTCLVAFAAIIGPYYVGAASPKWGSQTYQDDARSDYDGAEDVFTALVQPAITSPAARINAIKNDYLRVIYYDNKIADFKITGFDLHLNLRFVKLQPSADAPAPPGRVASKAVEGKCGAGASFFTTRTTYETGYWGYSWTDPVVPGPPLPMTATPKWISTGQVTEVTRETCK